MSRRVFAALAVSLALAPAFAQEPGKPAWHLVFHNNYGAEGFTAVLKLDPGLSSITLVSHEEGHETHEVGRRILTPEENETVRNALARFASADLKPSYDNPNVSDGFQLRVEFVAPDGREGGIQVANVAVPELNTLIATVSPLLPPTSTGRPALVPLAREIRFIQPNPAPAATKELFDELEERDRKLYDIVFKTCDLEALRGLVAADFEMYHDKSGLVAKSGSQFVMNIRYLCDRRMWGEDYPARRELVEGTLEVHPLNGYGAIQTGVHRFYREGGAQPVEVSRFTHIWKKDADGEWKLARAMSYDHKMVE
jgi:Domain of unknown function (DUF4440)